MSTDCFGLAYAALVTVGGLIGYFKAGSVASLASGLVFGALTGFGAYTQNDAVLLAGSGLLGGVMGYRFYNSHKVFPAGVVFVLSVCIFVRSAYRSAL